MTVLFGQQVWPAVEKTLSTESHVLYLIDKSTHASLCSAGTFPMHYVCCVSSGVLEAFRGN